MKRTKETPNSTSLGYPKSHAINPLVNGLAFQPKNDLVKEAQINNTLNLITSIEDTVEAILKIGRTMSGS